MPAGPLGVPAGHGLGVLAVNQAYPAALEGLFNAAPEEQNAIRQFFHRLGTGLQAAGENWKTREQVEWLAVQLEQEKAQFTAQLAQQIGTLAVQLEQEKAQFTAQLADVTDQLDRSKRLERRYNALCRWLPVRIVDAYLAFGRKGLLNKHLRSWSPRR